MTAPYSNSQLQTYKPIGRYDIPLAERLMMQMTVTETGCWQWRGATTTPVNGYGRVRVNGIKTLAHRASFELFVRPIPTALTLDHFCRNRLCLNPSHLIPKTQHANILVGESRMAQLAVAPTCRNGHEFSFEFYNLKGRRLFRRFCPTCRTARLRDRRANG